MNGQTLAVVIALAILIAVGLAVGVTIREERRQARGGTIDFTRPKGRDDA